jgi:hypothetical protein
MILFLNLILVLQLYLHIRHSMLIYITHNTLSCNVQCVVKTMLRPTLDTVSTHLLLFVSKCILCTYLSNNTWYKQIMIETSYPTYYWNSESY